jgi:trans-aconitate methyltransferase
MKTETNPKLGGDYEIRYPDLTSVLDQDEEWVEVSSDGTSKKIRIHDYDEMYSIPGLYEEVVYNRLKCRSPEVVTGLLAEEIAKTNDNPEELGALNVLDFGAGNGVVADYLVRNLDCNHIIGVDIISEAKEAAYRDRPGVYDDYFIADFCNLTEKDENELISCNINALITVAALGFHDISTKAFLNASKLLPPGGWIAFNIRDKFLSETDCTGFRSTIEDMMNNSFEIVSIQRYCHRESLKGEKLYYYAIIARKTEPSAFSIQHRSFSDFCAENELSL